MIATRFTIAELRDHSSSISKSSRAARVAAAAARGGGGKGMTSAQRSAAAKKGWETRRKNGNAKAMQRGAEEGRTQWAKDRNLVSGMRQPSVKALEMELDQTRKYGGSRRIKDIRRDIESAKRQQARGHAAIAADKAKGKESMADRAARGGPSVGDQMAAGPMEPMRNPKTGKKRAAVARAAKAKSGRNLSPQKHAELMETNRKRKLKTRLRLDSGHGEMARGGVGIKDIKGASDKLLREWGEDAERGPHKMSSRKGPDMAEEVSRVMILREMKKRGLKPIKRRPLPPVNMGPKPPPKR